MGAPRYQEVAAGTVPEAHHGGATVRVVAGEFEGVRGPVTEIAAGPLYMDVTLDPGAEICIPVTPGHTVVAYLFEGKGIFGLDKDGQGQAVEAVSMVLFEDGDALQVKAGEEGPARFMLMTGAPFNEPIFPYGPFVMNTREEIEQTLAELRNGTFIK
jgi:hypothetical protein